MIKQIKCFAAALILLTLTANLSAQSLDNVDGRTRWEASVFAGMLTGGSLSSVVINGETVKNTTDDAFLTGVRLSAEQEYIGLEASVAAAFGDGNVEADPASLLGSHGDATTLLTNLNVLIFPAGNTMGNGRIRFFITGGPGLAYIDGDFAGDQSDLMLDLNAGAGIKFLLGDQGNPVLRIDYRWHRLFGDGSDQNDMNLQEVSIGLGFRF